MRRLDDIASPTPPTRRSPIPHRHHFVHNGQNMFTGSHISITPSLSARHRMDVGRLTEEFVEFGQFGWFHLPLAVVRRREHDFDGAAEVEYHPREQLVRPAGQAGHADEVLLAVE